jgi:hypothetical protein
MRRATVTCPRCEHINRDVRLPSPLWWIALAASALVFVGMIFAASLIGPFIMFAIPIIALVGLSFGPLYTLATVAPTCARCGRALDVAPTDREARARSRRPSVAPARAAA